MCGIAGFYGVGSREVLERMGHSLAHRGPDSAGVSLSGKVGLAHRRLAILDLSPSGAQPMENARGDIRISYNGEVFNFQELREAHLGGVSLRSTSDTEVILALYEKLGVDAFPLLEGMYAFALYDARVEKLYLVRDPLGKKPLYVARTPEALLFGSELKALREHPACPTELDRVALGQYLSLEYIPAPRTILLGVEKVMPGSYVEFDGRDVKRVPFRSFSLAEEPTAKRDVVEEFRALLASSVERRMVADVPVGVFLSGGLDSSAVAAVASEQSSALLETFSIGFDDPSFDEQDDARLVAKHLGTNHHDLVLGVGEIRHIADELPDILDEPIADSSIIPTALVSRFAREQVTVALSGDGADELLWGYDTFVAHRIARRLAWVPRPLVHALHTAAQALPVSHGYMSFDFRVKRMLRGLATEPRYRNATWMAACSPEEVTTLTKGAIPTAAAHEQLDRWYEEAGSLDAGLQLEYLKGYLIEDILVKVDRASMRYGLEVRSPFLDERLVQFALALPETWKLCGSTRKYLLREVVRDQLPPATLAKKKQGFNIPIGRLILEEMQDEVREVLLSGPLVTSGLFDRKELGILLQRHTDGVRDERKAIWALYVLARWLTRWYD